MDTECEGEIFQMLLHRSVAEQQAIAREGEKHAALPCGTQFWGPDAWQSLSLISVLRGIE